MPRTSRPHACSSSVVGTNATSPRTIVGTPAAGTVQDAKVRDLVAKSRRAYAKRGVVPDKKAALTLEPLQAMLATCDDSLRGVRDRALLLFAWSSGGRRRSEVTDATMENTRRIGPRAYSFTLLHSKTNQTGVQRADSEKPINACTGAVCMGWGGNQGQPRENGMPGVGRGGAPRKSCSALAPGLNNVCERCCKRRG